MTNTEPKVYTIKKDGIDVNIKVVKEMMGDDDYSEDTNFRVYIDKLIKTITNQTDKENFIEKLEERTLRIFKIIVEDSDTQYLIRNMYDDNKNLWIKRNITDAVYKSCSKFDSRFLDTCLHTPKFFYDFLIVNKEDIVKEPVVALTEPDVTTDDTLTKPDAHVDAPVVEARLKEPDQQGGNRRRRNNKKSKRKSKNNRKKTNRRR